MHDVDDFPDARTIPGLVVYRYDAPSSSPTPRTSPPRHRRGGTFRLARVKQDLLVRLHAFGLAEKIGTEMLFPTLPTAVAAYERWAAEYPLPGPGGG